jgi:phosphoglycerate dehydrogenase-like enzyme
LEFVANPESRIPNPESRAAPVHRLLILSRRASEYRDLVAAAALPDLDITSTTDPSDAVRAADCDCALGEPSLLCEVIGELPAVRWVQSTWAGVEPLLHPALRRDYVLTNARGVFGGLMSEYVFAYMLAHERKLLDKYRAQIDGAWDPTPPGTLRGKTLGLLGVGTIGAALARTAKHFGMRVNGYTRRSEESADVDAYFHGDRLAPFARDLDYLVSVMPATARTRGLVSAAFLRALPPRAVFINPGRGGVVDEPALADALQNDRLAGAVLDVFAREPLPPDHVFWRTPRLLITSHTAALSFPEDIAPIFIDNYQRLRRGEPLRYRVDFEQEY